MNQLSFADTEFTSKRRKTRKELFLRRMDELIPWQQLEDQIEKSRQWSSPLSFVYHVAYSFYAELVQHGCAGIPEPQPWRTRFMRLPLCGCLLGYL